MTTPRTETSGLLVVDKPAGWTSHQVVGRVRRLLGTRKVGHAGTLDPMATGVLVVGVNRATRLLGHLSLTDKAYEATIRLGSATITDDADGDVVSRSSAAGLTDVAIESELRLLRGPIAQIPSAVSAIKVAGVRSYARVRGGEAVTLPARPVHVHRLDVRERHDAGEFVDLAVVVECSSGTYVRALARDLGQALGTGGHLTALRRTAVGSFTLIEAQSMDEDASELRLIGMADVARRCFTTVDLSAEQATDVRFGRRLTDLILPAPTAAVLGPDGAFLALYRQVGQDAVADAVFVG